MLVQSGRGRLRPGGERRRYEYSEVRHQNISMNRRIEEAPISPTLVGSRFEGTSICCEGAITDIDFEKLIFAADSRIFSRSLD
jgi:hypothetical protein